MGKNGRNHSVKQPGAQSGLSLLELVIYVGTASIALLGVIAAFTMLANSWVRVQSRARVEEGARLAVERLRFEIESAQSVIVPGPGGVGPTLTIDSGGTTRTYSGYAWSPAIGWISFGCSDSSGGVTLDDCNQTDDTLDNYQVSSSFDRLSGFANTEHAGGILFDCADSGMATACQTSHYQVSVDAEGGWNGWAYGEGVGWISMNCKNTGSCFASGTLNNPCSSGEDSGNWRACEVWDTSTDPPQLEVRGWGWSDQIGWISFSSDNPGAGGGQAYGVVGSAPTLLEFGVDTPAGNGQLYVREAGGALQYLTDDDVAVTPCPTWGADYFRTVANPAPARAAVTLCFLASYAGPGSSLTRYDTEVQTTFEVR